MTTIKDEKLVIQEEDPKAYTEKNTVVFWKNTLNNESSHGNLTTLARGKEAAKIANKKYFFIQHVAVTLTHSQLSMIEGQLDLKDALDQYSPFKQK